MTKSNFKGAVIRWIRTIGMCLAIFEVMKVDVVDAGPCRGLKTGRWGMNRRKSI